MFPLTAVIQMQTDMMKQMTIFGTHAFFLSMIPVQMMRQMMPLPLAQPLPKGRACMPFRF